MPTTGTIFGIDPSSKKLAITVGRSGGRVPERFITKDLPEDTRMNACGTAAVFMEQLVIEYPDVVMTVLEAPVLGRGGPGSTIPQAMLSGAIQAGVARAYARIGGLRPETNFRLINNQSWKTAVVGIGNAGKDQITDWMQDTHPWVYEQCLTTTARGKVIVDQDLIDSACIWMHGQHFLPIWNKINRMKGPVSAARKEANRRSKQAARQAG